MSRRKHIYSPLLLGQEPRQRKQPINFGLVRTESNKLMPINLFYMINFYDGELRVKLYAGRLVGLMGWKPPRRINPMEETRLELHNKLSYPINILADKMT